MSRPIRVAILDHTGQLGGAELALVRLCAALDPSRIAVVVVLFADGPLVARLAAAGVDVRVLALAPRIAATDRHAAGRSFTRGGLTAAVATVPFVLRLARLLRAIDPDVVHSTSLKADLLAVPACVVARRPLVWHVHDLIGGSYLPALLARVVRTAARYGPRHVVVNSLATARSLLPLRRGWTLAYPGLAPEQVIANPELRTAPEPPVVGLVGRVSPTKGQSEFVEAAAVVAEHHPDVRFRVVGSALFSEAGYEQEVRDLAGRLGISDRVEFTGWVADPTAEMDRLSVLVHASPMPEPFGQVVIEAMARGVPVVATRGGGVGEIVEPDGAEALGVLVAPGDARDLARGILEVLADPAGAERRARAAWSDVVARFPVERTAEIVSEVWEGLRERGRGLRRRG